MDLDFPEDTVVLQYGNWGWFEHPLGLKANVDFTQVRASETPLHLRPYSRMIVGALRKPWAKGQFFVDYMLVYTFNAPPGLLVVWITGMQAKDVMWSQKLSFKASYKVFKIQYSDTCTSVGVDRSSKLRCTAINAALHRIFRILRGYFCMICEIKHLVRILFRTKIWEGALLIRQNINIKWKDGKCLWKLLVVFNL